MMKTIDSSFTPLSRHDHELRLMKAQKNHPWIAKHHIDPAPGHWGVVEGLFKALEVLLPKGEREGMLLRCTCATLDESLKISWSPNAIDKRRVHLVETMIKSAESHARSCCAFCGAPVSAYRQGTRRCVMHLKEIRLFADDPAGADAFPLDDWDNHKKHAQEALKARQAKVDEETFEPADADAADDFGACFEADAEDIADIEHDPATAEDDADEVLRIRFPDKKMLEAFVSNASSPDRKKRHQSIAEQIKAVGLDWRELGVLPSDWRAQMDAFEALFPNFSELTELLRQHFALSSLGDGRIKWPSVLLVGEAGIGKTEAARWLAERFGLPFHVFDMATSQTGSPLAGSEVYWSNSDTGDLLEGVRIFV